MQSVSKNKGFDLSSKLRLYKILKTNPLNSWILKQSAIFLKKTSFSRINILNLLSKDKLKMFCNVSKNTK